MLGNTDGDADFEEIAALGARSFSIFNADTNRSFTTAETV
jgi:hypothetical protein